MLPMAVILSDH